jgi:hypothetical protein
MRYIRHMTDVPEASAKLGDPGTQPVVLNVRSRYASIAYAYTFVLAFCPRRATPALN